MIAGNSRFILLLIRSNFDSVPCSSLSKSKLLFMEIVHQKIGGTLHLFGKKNDSRSLSSSFHAPGVLPTAPKSRE
jgi:hypothetical protein